MFWTPAAGGLTRQGFAGVGVPLQGLVAVHAQALVGAVGVDAALAAREDGGALVHVHARLPVVLQEEAWPAFALREQQRATSADESSLICTRLNKGAVDYWRQNLSRGAVTNLVLVPFVISQGAHIQKMEAKQKKERMDTDEVNSFS